MCTMQSVTVLGEPNDYASGEDCGALRVDWSNHAGRWNDGSCKVTLIAVCKKDGTLFYIYLYHESVLNQNRNFK